MQELRNALATVSTQKEANVVQMKAFNAFHKGELTPAEFGEISGEIKAKVAGMAPEAESTADKAKDMAQDAMGKAKDLASGAMDKAKGLIPQWGEEDIAEMEKIMTKTRFVGRSIGIGATQVPMGFIEGLIFPFTKINPRK